MSRSLSIVLAMTALVIAALPATASAGEITGTYMEARTCQVYTGPCFANGEVGLSGQRPRLRLSGHTSGLVSGVNPNHTRGAKRR